MSAFPSFSRLPAELRLAIWQMALPAEDEPEVYFASRDDFDMDALVKAGYDPMGDNFDGDEEDWYAEAGYPDPWEATDSDESSMDDISGDTDSSDESDDNPSPDLGDHDEDGNDEGGNDEDGSDEEDEWEDDMLQSPQVTVAFPAMMHVNREARAFARGKLTFREDTLRDGSVVEIPCRDFNPSIDAFHVNGMDMPFITSAICTSSTEWFKDIKHLSFQAFCLVRRFDLLLPIIGSSFTGLRTLSVVFGPCWRDGSQNNYGQNEHADPFDPIKHFRLAAWRHKKGRIVHSDISTEQPVKEIIEGIEDSLAMAEVGEDSPWDSEGDDGDGAWLFQIDAKQLVQVPHYGVVAQPKKKKGEK